MPTHLVDRAEAIQTTGNAGETVVAEHESLLEFGLELRRLRCAAGLSLRKFAELVHYSTGHLSKVENGFKPPSVGLARQSDALLGASGRLATLADLGKHTPSEGTDPEAPVGVGSETTDERRRRIGAAGPTFTWPTDSHPTEIFQSCLADLRSLGQSVGPTHVIPLARAHTAAVENLARQSSVRPRDDLLAVGARLSEYTGWMYQESGDDKQAMVWTDRAVSLAAEAGDDNMASYALVRRALVALYQYNAIETIQLAREAEAHTSNPSIRSLAASRGAQGHAIAGDESECMRALDRARVYIQQYDDVERRDVAYGTTNVVDPVSMVTGWCLHDLGRSAEAATVLADELDMIPVKAERTRARFGIRLAVALATIRELDQAAAVAEPILTTVPRLDSATVRIDLREYARTLNRWNGDPAVRGTMASVTRALRGRFAPTPAA